VLFIRVPKCKPAKCPSTDEWRNKMYSSHRMEYLALKSYEVYVNPENMMPSEEARDIKATYCMNSAYVKSPK